MKLHSKDNQNLKASGSVVLNMLRYAKVFPVFLQKPTRSYKDLLALHDSSSLTPQSPSNSRALLPSLQLLLLERSDPVHLSVH